MLTFREARLDDISELERLEQAVVEAERPFNSAIRSEGARYYDIPNLINSSCSRLIVAEGTKGIVATGYVQIRASKPSLAHQQHGYLGFMYVDPDYRGQGLNQQILDQLIAWGRSQDIQNFYLDVYAANASAIRAYEKVGFEPSLLEMKLGTSS